MAYRSKTRFARRAPRKRAVWVNIPFGSVQVTVTITRQLLLLPEDWEASFTGLTNEQAVLRAIVGELTFVQATACSASNKGAAWFWGLYMAGIDKATPPFTTTGMSDVSWLLTGCRAQSPDVTSSINVCSTIFTQQIHVAAKRKLTTNSQISLASQFGNDASGAPAGVISGIVRFLIARD